MKQYVVADPGIMGGAPVIAGTRIPIVRILFLLKEGYTIEMLHEEFPHVTQKTIEKAIDEVISHVASPKYASEISQA